MLMMQYYLEPGTGKKLRSLREVERYLNGETVSRRRKSTSVVIASNRPSSGVILIYSFNFMDLFK